MIAKKKKKMLRVQIFYARALSDSLFELLDGGTKMYLYFNYCYVPGDIRQKIMQHLHLPLFKTPFFLYIINLHVKFFFFFFFLSYVYKDNSRPIKVYRCTYFILFIQFSFNHLWLSD
jgi:hypothetical protein